ncbi:MAG TPA: ketoacyl-ACP synthase III [Firmicutes bacterium]|nr:ketoacyl-ACP synthase III [Bacillota bacterium]
MKFLSTGSFVPPRRMTNQDFEKIVDTSDQWIVERTGIHARHVAEEETTLTMAMAAAKQAMEGVDPSAICLVLVATFTPDQATPSVASQLQQALGLPEEVLAYDINAACSGFLFALLTAERLLEAMPGKCALLVGAEKVSGRLDYTDRGTCILFGDGAGAAVVQADGRPTWADYGNRSNGSAIYTDEKGLLRMEGRQVYQFAVRTVTQSIRNVLEKAGLEPGQLDHVVCHQANHRIIEAVARHLGAPMELFFENLGEYGNTSAASIPLALDEMHRNGMLKSGQRVLLEGFGSGLSWGSYLFEW